MKFTKEDAHKELVSQTPNKGQTLYLSERSINEQLDTLIPLLATDDTELSDFIAKVLPIFKTADGNVRNDVSVGIKTYKENNPVERPKKEETVVVESKKEDDTNSALLKRIEELEKKNADNEKKSTISQRRAEILSKMGEKGCKDTEWINQFLEVVNLDGASFNADEHVDKYIKIYNKKEAQGKRVITPKTPGGDGGDTYFNDVIKAAAEKAKAEGILNK